MIARILDSRIIDLLLIILALRFVFPNLFSFKSFKSEKKTERIIVIQKEKEIEKKRGKKDMKTLHLKKKPEWISIMK